MDHHHQQQQQQELESSLMESSKIYTLTTNGSTTSPKSSATTSFWFEIRLFYVRISPCVISGVPEFLTLRQVSGVCFEINGVRVPASETTSSTLRRDRVDSESSEVTYVSTDIVRINGGVEFEVYEKENNNLLLCGSMERIESEWNMECYTAISSGNSAFLRPKLGICSPAIEVYVAGRCCDKPVILTKVINVSPRRRNPRQGGLDVIPEVEDESGKDWKVENALIRHRKLQLTETEDEYETEGKISPRWYPEDIYEGEDGQLSWFNAGVRVGVGIGLGMCLGIGIGVGLLMRSYQATTRRVRRFL